MQESPTEPFREKFLRAFFPMVKHNVKQGDLDSKDPLERFEFAIMEAAEKRRREREDAED